MVGNPDFVNESALNLRLTSNSPGISGGILNVTMEIPAARIADYAGNPGNRAIDRGVYERTD